MEGTVTNSDLSENLAQDGQESQTVEPGVTPGEDVVEPTAEDQLKALAGKYDRLKADVYNERKARQETQQTVKTLREEAEAKDARIAELEAEAFERDTVQLFVKHRIAGERDQNLIRTQETIELRSKLAERLSAADGVAGFLEGAPPANHDKKKPTAIERLLGDNGIPVGKKSLKSRWFGGNH